MLVDCDKESRYFINTLKQVDDTDNESNNISYWPAWQESMRQLVGISFVRGNVIRTQEHYNYIINHFPAVTAWKNSGRWQLFF